MNGANFRELRCMLSLARTMQKQQLTPKLDISVGPRRGPKPSGSPGVPMCPPPLQLAMLLVAQLSAGPPDRLGRTSSHTYQPQQHPRPVSAHCSHRRWQRRRQAARPPAACAASQPGSAAGSKHFLRPVSLGSGLNRHMCSSHAAFVIAPEGGLPCRAPDPLPPAAPSPLPPPAHRCHCIVCRACWQLGSQNRRM
jgi:hypothetical protein